MKKQTNNMEEYNVSGLIPDPRSNQERSKDISHRELYSAKPLAWEVKEAKDWAIFSLMDQNGGSYCVGEGGAKAFEVELGEQMSALPFYSFRANKPQKGMWLQDLGRIGVKIGTVRETLLPSYKLTEEQANAPVDMSIFPAHEIKKAKAYAFVNPKDIDAMAEILDSGRALILTFESNYDEWSEVPVFNDGAIQWGHCVCNPKDRTLWTDKNYDNEKALVVDESWGVGIKKKLPVDGKRVITEAFIKERCTGAMYFIFEKPIVIEKPKVYFIAPLTYGMKNAEVVRLQNILKYEGFMDKSIESTGNFLNYTALALKKWQVAHGIFDFQNESNLMKIRFGNKSIALANKLYA